jgi:hypothetical protein
MGSPISSIIADIFLHYYENMFIKHLFESKNIIYYSRYVDDIFIIYDNTMTDPDNLTNSVNNIHKDIIFKSTSETNNQINFLDLLIIRNESSIEIDIYRKPYTTDTTINLFSNHPIEHKLAAYRYYLTRMNSLPISTTRKQKEWTTIQHIAKTNNFPHTTIQKLNRSIQTKLNDHTIHSNTHTRPKKWTVFTYYHSSIRHITNMFKNINIGIALRSTNNIYNLLKTTKNNTTDQYTKSGIYILSCTTCERSYVGQTGRT